MFGALFLWRFLPAKTNAPDRHHEIVRRANVFFGQTGRLEPDPNPELSTTGHCCEDSPLLNVCPVFDHDSSSPSSSIWDPSAKLRPGNPRPPLEVVNCVGGVISPLLGNVDLSRMRTSTVQPGRVWLRSSGAHTLSYIDLNNELALGFVRLDNPVEDLAVVGAGAGPGSLLVVHPGNDGFVSSLDAAVPARATAHSIRGFAAQNLLDRTERTLP